ncbi:MAG: hypothetical protein AB4062_15125 [Crocosphaera sp.]
MKTIQKAIALGLTASLILFSFAEDAEARRRRRRGRWSGSSNGIFTSIERDYTLIDATTAGNSIPIRIEGSKNFGVGTNTMEPLFDTLFNNSLELDLDVLARSELGDINTLTPDLAQEVTQLQLQGAQYGEDYFLFDNAALFFNSALSLGGVNSPEIADFSGSGSGDSNRFVTPNSDRPSDSDSDNFYITNNSPVIDTINILTRDVESNITTNVGINTQTILVSRLRVDDELVIGLQDDVNIPGAFYRQDELPDFCSSNCDSLGFNLNNGVSFPVSNSLSGQFNPSYVENTEGILFFKYRILIDLVGDADKYYLFVPAFTAPDAGGNFNELNNLVSPSLFDFFEFSEAQAGGCTNSDSPENAICLGGLLDLGSDSVETKITEQINLLDDLTVANADNPNVILEESQLLEYRRTDLVRPADSDNEGLFRYRPYGVFSPPVEFVINEEDEPVTTVPEPTTNAGLITLGLLGIGVLGKNRFIKRKL